MNKYYPLPTIEENIVFDNDFLKNIQGIAFELSNTCNLSQFHSKCPTSWYKEKIFLEENIIFKCLEELASVEFSGIIRFHRYNEPLLDKKNYLNAWISVKANFHWQKYLF